MFFLGFTTDLNRLSIYAQAYSNYLMIATIL